MNNMTTAERLVAQVYGDIQQQHELRHLRRALRGLVADVANTIDAGTAYDEAVRVLEGKCICP